MNQLINPISKPADAFALPSTPVPNVVLALHSLIERTAQRTPDATAVLHGATRISFAELERRSRRLAVQLRESGVSRGDSVALAIDRSPELLMGMLGVLRAGAGFISLERLSASDGAPSIGEGHRAETLLVNRRKLEAHGKFFRRVIVIEDEQRRGDLPTEHDPLPAVDLDAIAYLTAGLTASQSTSTREFTHREVLAAIGQDKHFLRFNTRDRLLALSSDAFDRTAHYLFGVLAAGGAIVVPDAARVESPGHWADLLVRERVTIWNSAPEQMRKLVNYAASRSPGVLTSLRHVILQGGKVSETFAARVRTLAYRAELTQVSDLAENTYFAINAAAGMRPAMVSVALEGREALSSITADEDRPGIAGPDGAEDRNGLPPRGDELECVLIEFWEQALETSPIAVDDNFFNLGGDSMAAAMIFARVERALGKRYLAETLLDAPTVKQLASLIREPAPASSPNSAISAVVLQQGDSPAPVFCVSCGQGSLWEFRKLARHLGPSFTVYGLAPPGLDGASEPLDCVAELAEHYLRQIRQTQPAGPYRLLGFSFGGAVAYDIAQQLDAAGERVEVLGLLDAPARGYGAAVRALKSMAIPLFHSLRAAVQLWRRTNKSAAADPALSDAFDREYLPGRPRVFAASSRALDRYRARPYRGGAVLILAQHRPWPRRLVRDERRSWLRLVQGGCETHLVPASHEDFFSESHIGLLADTVRSVLQRLPG